jgi:hypothetical protein
LLRPAASYEGANWAWQEEEEAATY